MTSERLGEMLKGDSADTFAGKFPLVLVGGRADPSSMCRQGARTPIGANGNFQIAFECFMGIIVIFILLIRNDRSSCFH